MREKIKLVIPYEPPAPEPLGFICDLCGKITFHYQAAHRGDKQICHFHGTRSDHRLNFDFEWKDMLQMVAIKTVISEINAHGKS